MARPVEQRGGASPGGAQFRLADARERDEVGDHRAAPGVFSYGGGDKLVAFAARMGSACAATRWSGIAARRLGEALPPTSCAPRWPGTSPDVAGRYRGKIGAWDVVNEALADGPSGQLRSDSPFTALGPTFIDEAFRAAHEADPDAQLFYNDYEIEGEGPPSPRRRSRFASAWSRPAFPSRASACRCTSIPATGRRPRHPRATWNATPPRLARRDHRDGRAGR